MVYNRRAQLPGEFRGGGTWEPGSSLRRPGLGGGRVGPVTLRETGTGGKGHPVLLKPLLRTAPVRPGTHGWVLPTPK